MEKMSAGKILTVTLILAFLAIPFLLFPATTGTMHHAHLPMSLDDCPYMLHDQALCPFNLAHYLGIWNSIFASSLLSANLLMFFAVFAIGVGFSITTFNQHKIRLRKKKENKEIKILYRELFSIGLLNPKVF